MSEEPIARALDHCAPGSDSPPIRSCRVSTIRRRPATPELLTARLDARDDLGRRRSTDRCQFEPGSDQAVDPASQVT